MPFVDFRRPLPALSDSVLAALFRECAPRILVVTDGLNFEATDDFGLTQFVNSLRAATIHGMVPSVTTASRGLASGDSLANFKFDSPVNGLTIARYDVVFLLGSTPEGSNELPLPEVAVLARFMQEGGGVFATGDHETLGASLCGNIPRVRNMRKWKAVDTPPHVRTAQRHSTNMSGADETEEFNDQRDSVPQHLYVNYLTRAAGTATVDRLAHPLLQMKPPRKVLEVFPDHPHEGECRVPTLLNTSFTLQNVTLPEWPNDAIGKPVVPELAAFSVSHGDGFPTGPTGPKDALTPKLFGAICAYDGHRAQVGRVVTDATWHHFVNVNMRGFTTPTDSDAMIRIRQYYVNLATWLMPKKTRRCGRSLLVLQALKRDPLFEELDLPMPADLNGLTSRDIGRGVLSVLRRQEPAYLAQSLADDALEDAIGAKGLASLTGVEGRSLSTQLAQEMAETALGAVVVSMGETLAAFNSPDTIKPHENFEQGGAKLARAAVGALLKERTAEAQSLIELLGQQARLLS